MNFSFDNVKASIKLTADYLFNFKWEKIIKWVLFNISMAGVPLLSKFLVNCRFISNSCDEPIVFIFGQGDLILLSCAVLAEASSDLLDTSPNIAIKRLSYTLIGFAFIIIFLNASIYVTLDNISDKAVVVDWSIDLLIVSLIIGFISKFLGKD
jgi:hypothetical protein